MKAVCFLYYKANKPTKELSENPMVLNFNCLSCYIHLTFR